MTERLPSYGGQAVIEGVMMRGTQVCAIAVRAPDKSIRIERQPLGALYRSRLAKVPFLRGLLVLWDALSLGLRALSFSADVHVGATQPMGNGAMAFTMLASLALGLGLFFLLPAGAGYLAERGLGLGPWWANLLEGLVRLGLLVGYIAGIGMMPEIRRVFAYHGAEHMTINAYEAGAPLDVASVARFPREHARCGTAFLLTVVVFSIVLFGALGPLPLAARLASRLALVPLLASLAYEYIRLTARLEGRSWLKPLLAPNLALQRLTTRVPDASMIEVALAAFAALREQEQGPVAEG